MVIVGWLADSSITFFTLREDGHLSWDITAVEVPSLPWQWIRVVGICRKEWHVDLVVEVEQVQSCQLWDRAGLLQSLIGIHTSGSGLQ